MFRKSRWIAYFQNYQLMASVAEMMGSRFGQIRMPAFGQQGAATRRGEGVSTGEGAGGARSGGGALGAPGGGGALAVNGGLFTDGAGAAGVANASYLSGNIGPAGLGARGDHGQGSGRWNQHNLANQLEAIKVLILSSGLCIS